MVALWPDPVGSIKLIVIHGSLESIVLCCLALSFGALLLLTQNYRAVGTGWVRGRSLPAIFWQIIQAYLNQNGQIMPLH